MLRVFHLHVSMGYFGLFMKKEGNFVCIHRICKLPFVVRWKLLKLHQSIFKESAPLSYQNAWLCLGFFPSESFSSL